MLLGVIGQAGGKVGRVIPKVRFQGKPPAHQPLPETLPLRSLRSSHPDSGLVSFTFYELVLWELRTASEARRAKYVKGFFHHSQPQENTSDWELC